jgi:hypothetical protein
MAGSRIAAGFARAIGLRLRLDTAGHRLPVRVAGEFDCRTYDCFVVRIFDQIHQGTAARLRPADRLLPRQESDEQLVPQSSIDGVPPPGVWQQCTSR